MNPVIQFKTSILPLLIVSVLACFALSQTAQAQLPSPAPDGGYPNQTTAEGDFCLRFLTSGVGNTGLGFAALGSVTTGSGNTGIGAGALFFNTADQNTAVGSLALLSNTFNGDNTAIGFAALLKNTEDENTAVGSQALLENTTGADNAAVGFSALLNSTGDENTVVGWEAVPNLITGNDNTVIGAGALFQVGLSGTASNNIALGDHAGANLNALAGNDNNIEIGNVGGQLDTGTIRIGDQAIQGSCFIAGIFGVNSSPASAVFINSNGQLGTVSSSRRFKKEIKPMDKTSEAILAFKPVTFRYKDDDNGTPQFGLIAEDVAEVNPDLVIRDNNGEIFSVRYEAVNAMLLNEFLKEHRKVEDLEKDFQSTIAQQQKEIKALTATVKEQAAQIQKVSAQIELSKPAPQTVANNQ